MVENLSLIFGEPCERVALSQDGTRLAAIHGEHFDMLTIWESPDPSFDKKYARKSLEMQSNRGAMIAIAFSPTHDTIAIGYRDMISLLNVTSGDSILEIEIKNPGAEQLRTLSFSPDGKHLASGFNLGYPEPIKIWDAHTGHEIKTLTFDEIQHARIDAWRATIPLEVGQYRTPPSYEREPEATFVNSICYSPDGKDIAFGSEDFGVRIWNLETSHVQHLIGHRSPVTSVAYSPDGNTLASTSTTYLDTNIPPLLILWDVKARNIIHQFQCHDYGLQQVLFSPGGNLVIVADDSDLVMVWDVNTHQLVHEIDLRNKTLKNTDIIRINDIACPRQKNQVAIATSKSLLLWMHSDNNN